MPLSYRQYALLAPAATLATALVLSTVVPAHAQERKSLRWATSPVGSYGYAITAAIVSLVEQALDGEYRVTVHPYPSTTIAMRFVMDGSGEVGYTADIGMTQLHAGVGPFKGYKPKVSTLAHTWYAYPMESLMATSAKLASKFKCWKDFSGQPVFYTNAGFMNWLNWQRIYNALGYNFRHLQIDLSSNFRLLERGTIVGSAAYTTAGRQLPAYWRETEIRMNLAIVNPCPDEIEKLKAAGLSVVDVDPKNAFSKPVGPAVVQGVPILFGFNMRLDMPEDVVYRLLSALYQRRDELVRLNPGFTPLASDFIGLQVHGINANPEVPVHPGLAKFLKEHGAWNEKWVVGGGA